jgi:hypothetical protein
MRARHALQQTAHLIDLERSLSAEGIETLVLKGPPLALFGYGLLALIPGGLRRPRRQSRGLRAAGDVYPGTAGIAFALSVAANLTLLFPCLGAAAGAAWLSGWPARGRHGRARGWLRLGVPAGAALLLLAIPAFYAARRGLARATAGGGSGVLQSAQKANYYLGELSTAGSVHALLGGSLGVAGTTRLAAGLLAFAAAAIVLLLVVGARRLRRGVPRVRTAILFGSSLFGAASILAVLHMATGLPLPQARTGLPFLVLFPFVWGASILLLPRRAIRVVFSVSAFAGAMIVFQFIRISSRSDLVVPDSKGIVDVLQGLALASPSPWRGGASWFAAPNLEFSRRLVRASALAPIGYREPLCVGDFDAYVLLGADLVLADSRFDLVFRDPRSGAVVAIPRAGAPGRNAPPAPCPPARRAEQWRP